jgi:predicted RNase H-like HicB family nuclease
MRTTAIIERCPSTLLYIGYLPGIPGAHSQGKTIDKLLSNLTEVVEMLKEDGPLEPESEFIGLQTIEV